MAVNPSLCDSTLAPTVTCDMDDNSSTWKERCHMANKQLDRFRQKAGRIREVLAIKMHDYEDRVVAAERRCEEAVKEVEKLQMSCRDKDEAISALREKITRLREDHANSIILDEERMVKIKEWVRTKFTAIIEDLEACKRERDELRQMYSHGENRKAPQSPHHYEDVVGELINELEDSSSTYESVQPYRLPTYQLHSSSFNDADSSPPDIPPRNSSIRKCSYPGDVRHVKLNNSMSSFGSKSSFHSRSKSSSSSLSSMAFKRSMANVQEEDESQNITPLLNTSPFKINTEAKNCRAENVKRNLEEDSKIEEQLSPLYYELSSTGNADFEKDTMAPVYSTLEGIASQIRDIPFSGDTTDSEADIEEDTHAANDAIDIYRSTDAPPLPPPHSPLKTCAPFTAHNMNAETLQKAGYLTKLGGRIKNWKSRWFVLQDGKLNYYKSQGSMFGKPLGSIDLKQISQISKSIRQNTLEIITPKRTYHLTANNIEEVNDWLRVIRNSLKRISGVKCMPKVGEKTLHSGWVTKARCGASKHCWAVLKEKSILFYKSDFEQIPIYCMPLREFISVAPLDESSLSSHLGNQNEDGSVRLVIKCLKDVHPTYLLIASKRESELWLGHIRKMCGCGNMNNETEFEQIVSKLMSIDGDLGSRYWRNKVMIHSKQMLKKNLSSLPTLELEAAGIMLGKSIRLFSTTLINETAVDYHITLAQDIIEKCLTLPELQTEIYCQLIKQTSKYRSRPDGENYFLSNDWLTEDAVADQTIDMNPVGAFVYIQCWQLLCLCISIFLPKLKILWLLKTHLHRHANESSDVGRYALYCKRSLERILKNGERESRPSRLEAASILQRNPFYRIFPLSIRVDFINNSYQIFHFDGSTTVAEFSAMINEEIGIRDNKESGFALFTDNPIAQVEHCLQGTVKLCDVISKWEKACQQLRNGRFERFSSIKLTYKCRLLFKSLQQSQTEKEKILHVHQIYNILKVGHLLPNSQVLVILTALYAQIHYGNLDNHRNSVEDIVHKKYPYFSSIYDMGKKRDIIQKVSEYWADLRHKLLKDCVDQYISFASKVPFYGCSFFKAQEKLQQQGGVKERQSKVWIAIEEEKLHILSRDMEVRECYSWAKVVTFGGFKQDFMLVVQPDPDDTEKTVRHLFAMPPGRVMEVTLLIASYINAVVTRCGLSMKMKDCFLQRYQSVDDTGTNDIIHVWDMESFS